MNHIVGGKFKCIKCNKWVKTGHICKDEYIVDTITPLLDPKIAEKVNSYLKTEGNNSMLPRKKEAWEKSLEPLSHQDLCNLIVTMTKIANDIGLTKLLDKEIKKQAKERNAKYKLVKQLKPDPFHQNYEKWEVTGKIFAGDCTPNVLYRKVDGWNEIDWCIEYKDSKSFYRLPDEIGDELSVARHKILKNKKKVRK